MKNDKEIFITHKRIKAVADAYLDAYKSDDHGKSVVTGLATGFYDLDYHTKGLQNGYVILLAGMRLASKINLALNIAHHAMLKENATTIIFSQNMTSEELIKRLLAIDLGEHARAIYCGLHDDEEYTALEKSTTSLCETPLIIDDRQYITVEDIRNKCLRLTFENMLGLVIVDYLQLIDSEYIEKGQEKKRRIAGSLKELAKELKCPILVISELNSDGERKLLEHPEISDIDDDDFTKQYTDVIILMYEDVSSKIDTDNREAELTIVKNRNGSVGKVKLSRDSKWIGYKNILRN